MGSHRTTKTVRGIPLNLLLIFAALAIYLAVAWFFITGSYQKQPLQTGRLALGQAYTGEDYSKSLDLRIAARAVYPSSAISQVKDLGATSGVEQKVISFRVTTDKLLEHGLMYLPATKAPAGGYPVIILCHGYYNPEQYDTLTGYTADMQFYAQHGFAVIKPDFRGQGLTLLQGQPEGAYYSMDYNTDVMSLISAVKQTSYLNKRDINLWGHSMGAYIALRTGVLSPDIKNLILISGPLGDVKDMFQNYMPASDKDNPVALKLRESILIKYGTPTTNPKFWNATSPEHFASKLTANVQIYVGAKDIVVPPAFSAELNSALDKAHISHQYYVYADGDHGLEAQRPQIWQSSLSALTAESGTQ